MIHKLGLYTSYNIPPSTSHQLWIWNFLWLIRYYKSPCSILISTTLNHKLQLRILHLLIQMNSQLHFFPWGSSSGNVSSLKTPIHTSRYTTYCGRNDMCLASLSSILSTCMSNIKFLYEVSISPAYSSPFSKLSFVWFSITC